MIDSLRRHVWAVLVLVVVVLWFAQYIAVSSSSAGGSQGPTPSGPTATLGSIQEACQPGTDLNAPANWPTLPVVVTIDDGNDSAYVLAGPNSHGLTIVDVCQLYRNTSVGTVGGGGGGTVGPPLDLSLSLDQGGTTVSDHPSERLYAGRVGPTVARVAATLASGTAIEAKVSNGCYLVWARTGKDAVKITAYDAVGAEIRSIEDPNGLRPPR